MKRKPSIKDNGKKVRAPKAVQRSRIILQRSRGKYLKPAPNKLRRLIELVNTLPPFGSLEWTFLHPQHLEAQVEADLANEGGRENNFFDVHVARSIVEALQMRKLSPVLLDYVSLGLEEGGITSNRMMKDGGVVGRYKNLWIANIRLHNIAKLAQAGDQPYREKSTLWREPVPLPVLDEIDDEGIVRVSKDLFAEAMDEPVEAVRVRECPVCKCIFFAGRIDAWQCGDPRCKSVLSSRLNRDPELRKLYNKARRTKRRSQGAQAKKGKK